MNVQFRNTSTYVTATRLAKKQNINKENFIKINTNPKNDVKKDNVDVTNATYEEVSNVLNEISKERGENQLRLDIDKTQFIESMRRFLNSPRNPNPNMKLVVEGNPMFEGYGGVKSNWIELYERKANQQLKLGNKSCYERLMKSSNDLKEYYEKKL